MIIFYIAAAVFMIAVIWFLLCAPSPKSIRAEEWTAVRFAHRGLHDEKLPENSLSAFAAAVDAGYGIELDVRYTKDRQLAIAHDDLLKRVAGVDKKVSELTADELKSVHFPGMEESIPLFSEALQTIGGKVPVLVEIKGCRQIRELTRDTVALLRTYHGPYVVESFDPRCLRHLRRISPDIIRGQLVTKSGHSFSLKDHAMSLLLMNCLGRPDFIAYDKKMADSLTIRIQKKLFRTPLFVWTIRNKEEWREGEANIFENFRA